jgi:hypothetical protein
MHISCKIFWNLGWNGVEPIKMIAEEAASRSFKDIFLAERRMLLCSLMALKADLSSYVMQKGIFLVGR